ncbi:MAG: hypothetical protein R3222_07695 [Balneolaceae bacterium]|nr:hypothetical protein [Balneolaceae bacterium]
MKNILFLIQEDSAAAVDTLTKSYSQKWDAANGLTESSAFIQTAASYDLIFIVLAVSLIIWLVLLFFIIRVDKKVGRLEEQIEQTKSS